MLDVITHMSWVWEANRKINDKTANKNKITMLDAKDVEAFLSNRSELILASQRETMRSAEEDYYCLLDEQFTLQVLESLDIDLNVCLLPIKINFWLDSDYAGLASLKYLWDRISIKAVPDKFPPKISDLGDFDRNLIGLKVNLKIERLVIILYQTEAHHELVEILKGVSDIVYVGWITDQPVPFRSFHPESTNLGSAIQSWLDEISQE